MNNKEMIEYRIKEEGKEEFLTFDEANNLVFYFDFPASMISYFYKGKDGRIRSNIKVEIVLKDEDSFVGLNHISSSTSLYKLLQDTIDKQTPMVELAELRIDKKGCKNSFCNA